MCVFECFMTVYRDDDVSIKSLTPAGGDDDDDDESSMSGQLPMVTNVIKTVPKTMTQSREDTARFYKAKLRREVQATLRVISFLYTQGKDEVLSEAVIKNFFKKSVNKYALPASIKNLMNSLSMKLCTAHMSGIAHCNDVIANHFASICALIDADLY